MKLAGSCHCGAVKFTVDSHTPYPFMRCYCSICRKTAGGGGYAINIMGDAPSLRVRGAKNVRVYRARVREQPDARPRLSTARRHFCARVRKRAVGLRSAMARVGVPVCLGYRHAAAEAARGGGADAGFRGAVGRHSGRKGAHAFPQVP